MSCRPTAAAGRHWGKLVGMANWTADLRIGNPEVDEDHGRLAFLINELTEAVAARRSNKVLCDLLEELLAFAGEHFCREEQLMRRTRYPDFKSHKQQHDALLKDLRLLVRAVESGQRKVDEQTLSWLRGWMAGHVRGPDREFSAFISGDAPSVELGTVA